MGELGATRTVDTGNGYTHPKLRRIHASHVINDEVGTLGLTLRPVGGACGQRTGTLFSLLLLQPRRCP